MNRIKPLLTLLLSLFIVSSLAAEEKMNKAAKKLAKKNLVELIRSGATLELADNEKILILPTDMQLTGEKKKYNASLFAGFLAGFGDKAISLEPIKQPLEKAGLGDLSRRLSWGTWHMVSWHNSFDFVADAGFHGGKSEYAVLVDLVAQLVNLATEQLNIDAKIKYVAFSSVRHTSVPKLKAKAGFFGMECLGAIYNVEEGKVDKVFRKKMTGAGKDKDKREKFIMAQMVNLGNSMPEILLSTKVKK